MTETVTLGSLGEAIRFVRKAKGMTLKQLEHDSGVSRRTISRIEKNWRNVRMGYYSKLFQAMGVKVIFSLTDK